MVNDVAVAAIVVVGVLLTRVRSERGIVNVNADVDICKVVLGTVERLVVVAAGVRVEIASVMVVDGGVATIGVR